MNFKTTIALALIFVLLVGIYFVAFRGKTTIEHQAKETISTAYGIEKSAVTKIRLEFKDEAFKPFTLLIDDDGNWRFSEPIVAKADAKKIDQLLIELLDRKIKRRLPKPDNLAKYGLEEPQIKYTVWINDKSRQFLIGNKDITFSVYAKEATENSVLKIEHTVLEYFSKSPADLLDRDIFDFQPDQVTQIALDYPDTKIVCKREPESNEWRIQAGKKDKSEIYKITLPYEVKADFDEIRKFLDKLNELKIEDLETLERVDELFKITVSTEDSQISLQIGDKVPGTDRVYAKLNGDASIFSIGEHAAAELTKTLDELRDKQVLDFQRTDVDKFVLERPDMKIVCKQDAKGEWSIIEPINAKADKELIDDFLFRLDALMAKKFLDGARKYGLDPPSIKVMLYEIGQHPPVTLLIGARKDDMLYVKSNSPEQVFLVENDILEQVGKNASDFMDKNDNR